MDRRWLRARKLPIQPIPEKHSPSHQRLTLLAHIHRHTHRTLGRERAQRKKRKSRNKRWASNQRALQKLNQHRLSDEEEHFWFLWAGAFINHPQKKHHSTATWVEDPLFRHRLCRAKLQKNWKNERQGKEKEEEEEKSSPFSFQSVQSALVSFNVQRFNVSNEHQTSTCAALICFVCTFPCHISVERTFPLQCCQL